MERSQFTLKQLLVVCMIISFTVPLLVTSFMSVQEKARQVRCKANLDHMGKLMKVYMLDFSSNYMLPDTNGGGFLARLYQVELITNTNTYICPDTEDTTDGSKLQNLIAEDSDNINATSYAGRKNATPGKYPGIWSFGCTCPSYSLGTAQNKHARAYEGHGDATSHIVASDDFQASPNHEEGKVMIMLFLDGHSDHLTYPEAYGNNYEIYSQPNSKGHRSLDPVTN